jgi:hypothetical protein
MNSSKPVIVYSVILLFLLMIILWVVDYAGLGIPERFPGSSIQPYTLAMFAAMIILLILLQKNLIRLRPEINLTRLILAGVIVCISAQAIYQWIRQWLVLRNLENNKPEDYLKTMAVIAVMSFFLSLCVATELKKGNSLIRTASLLFVGALIYFIKEFVPNITW